MLHMKKFKDFSKINETGEWPRDLDWDYVKKNTQDQDQEATWIRSLEDQIVTLDGTLKKNLNLIIDDIKGFDMYQGPYANVRFETGSETIYCNVWTQGEGLFFENFPISNTDEEEVDGLKGNIDEIAEVLNDNY